MNLIDFIRKHSGQCWMFLIGITVLLVYFPLWQNMLVNWDDNVYITDNPLVRDFSIHKIGMIFSKSFEGHYHPLTLISLGFDSFFFGLDPRGFHLHNLVLHLLNCLLVYQVFLMLTGRPMIAGFTALLFGIHPMHVESVAWATARKDVLFTFWFLFSYLFWLRFIQAKKSKYLFFSLIFFIFSLLSKGQAVFLPVCLLVTDFFMGRSLKKFPQWKEKIPYFVLALVFGILALIVQKQTGYTGENTTSPSMPERFLVAGYAFSMYLYKLILPLRLAVYYPYPEYSPGNYPLSMWAGLLVFVIFIGMLIYSFLKDNRTATFGLLFFLVNLFVFLKWVPVSNYIIADRYTYVSSIGLFFILSTYLDRLRLRGRGFAIITGGLAALLFWFFSLASFARVAVWKDTLSLLDDTLIKYPKVYTALNSRGNEKLRLGDAAGAMQDFNKAIAIKPDNARAYANKGDLYHQLGMMREAMAEFDKAIALDGQNARYFNNRGIIRDVFAHDSASLDDFNRAISLEPGLAEAYNNRGQLLSRLERYHDAMSDYTLAVKLDPSNPKFLAGRAQLKNKIQDFRGAISDLMQARDLGLKTAPLYFELGFSHYNLMDFQKAIVFFDTALENDPSFVPALAYRAYSNYNISDFLACTKDLDLALAKDPALALGWGMRGLARIRLGDKPGACDDFHRAEAMGMTQVKKEIEKYCR